MVFAGSHVVFDDAKSSNSTMRRSSVTLLQYNELGAFGGLSAYQTSVKIAAGAGYSRVNVSCIGTLK